MAIYGEHKISKKEKIKAVGSGSTTFTFDAFSIPAGEKFYRFKINGTWEGSSYAPLQSPAASLGYNKWSTDTSIIKWTNGGKAKLVASNGGTQQGSFNQTITITFQTKYTKVATGNKIMATDRSKSGTSTTVGSKIQDSNFTAGTKITASDFNSKIGYTG